MILNLKNYIYLMILFSAGYAAAYWGSGPRLRRVMGPRLLVGYGITLFAGFFSPNVWLYFIVLIVAFVATVKDREDAICRYAVMLGLIPAVNVVVVAGPIYLGTYQAMTVVSVAMILACLIKPDRHRGLRPPLGWRVEDGIVIILFLIFSVGVGHSTVPTVVLRNCLICACDYLLPYYFFRRYVRSADELRLVIGCLAFSAVPIGLIAVYESRSGWPLYDAIVGRLSMTYGFAAAVSQRGGSLRAMASFSGPLGLAYFMLVALLAWLCSRRLFTKPLLWKGGIVLLALAIWAPKSRGGLIGLVPALIVLLVARRRYAAAAGVLAGAGLGAMALLALQHSSATIAMYVGGQRSGDYYDYRGLLLHRGLQEGMKHWFSGQGYMDVIASLADITQGEHIVDLVNSYLQMFLFSGVVGLVPFLLLSAALFRKLVARAPRGAALEAMRDNRAFLLAALTGTYVFMWGNSFGDRLVPYVMMLLAMARLCSALLVREPRLASRVMQGPSPAASSRPEQLLPA